jgi:hypothetical protein
MLRHLFLDAEFAATIAVLGCVLRHRRLCLRWYVTFITHFTYRMKSLRHKSIDWNVPALTPGNKYDFPNASTAQVNLCSW